ncbi:MAG: hypothetical protein HRT61_20540 [Ekhidna sp.]|nr:hypothetical protein [Ekhidna sp.]
MKYPVIALKKNDKMVYVFSKEKDLKSTSTELLEKDIFKNTVLVDSDGLSYQIDKTYKVKYLGLGGISLMKKGRQILMDFEFKGNPTTLKLDEFKRDILERINSNKNFWQSSWGDLSDLEKRVQESASFEAIANTMK